MNKQYFLIIQIFFCVSNLMGGQRDDGEDIQPPINRSVGAMASESHLMTISPDQFVWTPGEDSMRIILQTLYAPSVLNNLDTDWLVARIKEVQIDVVQLSGILNRLGSSFCLNKQNAAQQIIQVVWIYHRCYQSFVDRGCIRSPMNENGRKKLIQCVMNHFSFGRPMSQHISCKESDFSW